MNAILQFYGEIKDVILPLNYQNFCLSLSEMLQVPYNSLSTFSLFYQIKGKKYFINSAEDYSQLLTKLKNEEVRMIEIEIGKSEIEKKDKMKKSFIQSNVNKKQTNKINQKEINDLKNSDDDSDKYDIKK